MKRIVSLLSLLVLVANAHASEARFIDVGHLNAEQLLAPPAAPGSDASRSELATLHQIQNSRSSAAIARAQNDEALKSIFLYQNVLGEQFKPENLPLTAKFSRRIRKDVRRGTAVAKTYFHRIRPYNVDKTLAPVCEIKTVDNSYPSEHSTLGYVYALVLTEMMPEQRAAILARADEYASNRLLCGAHFPSDVAAGKRLAHAIYNEMDGNPRFQRSLTAARRELRTAYGLPALPSQ